MCPRLDVHAYVCKVIEVRGQEPLKNTLMRPSVWIDLDKNLDLQPLFTLRESLEWFRYEQRRYNDG